ncbi:interferon resistance protein [Cotia virus SPAn232]|uniref:Interferon resistance protein n=2 Tax=Cotia virus TaxID=39444 RepID=H6TAI2_9POXV|nr:interferon resistance protein [Cotia virus SPAn232]AFB76919.1 interferon resistance protein [Cotia virus SPAn232]AIT70644.1 interferon resistance protein [Cotia virus]
MLAFCYALPNVGDIVTGEIYEHNYALYIKLINTDIVAILEESVKMNAQKYFKYRDKLIGKTVKVRVVKVDYTKGYIDVTHNH